MVKSIKWSAALAAFILFIILCPALTGSAAAVNLPAHDGAGLRNTPDSEPLATPAVQTPLTVIDGKIGRKPVYTELVSCGVDPSDALSVTKAFKGVFDFRRAQPKDEYQVCLSSQKELQKLTYRSGLTDRYVAVRTEGGSFQTRHEAIPLEKETAARTFTIDSSLYLAVTGKGEGCQLVTAFTDIFSWDIDFYLYPRKGDTIRVLFEKYSLNGHFVKYGRILAAQYISSAETFSAFYFDDGRQAGYYDQAGAPLRKMFVRVPVKFGKRTSSFSTRRFHPISKRYKRHTGIDYGAPLGTPIYATAGGTVAFSGWQGGYGKLVIVSHPNGYKTYYGHCSRLLAKKGARVNQGQVIAKVGRTGSATGPHVHYETRVNGKPVDPGSITTARGTSLPPDQRARFEEAVQTHLRMVEDRLFSAADQNSGNQPELQ